MDEFRHWLAETIVLLCPLSQPEPRFQGSLAGIEKQLPRYLAMPFLARSTTSYIVHVRAPG